MSGIQPNRRLVGIMAGLAGILLALGLTGASWPAITAAAAQRGPSCHVSSQLPGTWVAVCDSSSSSTTTCGLIPLAAPPFRYPRRPPTAHGQQWAAMDCPGPYPFGGVILMPDSHRSAAIQPGRMRAWL